MKVLFIAYYFPPYNSIGAIRSSKLVKYLRKQGHDVKVLTAKDQPLPNDLDVEVPDEAILYTPWMNVNGPVEFLAGGRKKVVEGGYASHQSSAWKSMLGRWYKTLFHIPDGQIGWCWAPKRIQRRLKGWKPDLIYASASPFSSLFIAKKLSKRWQVPWVGEFRDLWVDNPYYSYPAWRKWLEERLERKALRTADGLVTVSESLAQILRDKYKKPTEVILNGYDHENYEEDLYPERSSLPLTVTYTGGSNNGRRNPSVVFQAIQRLDPQVRKQIRVNFYGKGLEPFKERAKEYGVEHNVVIYGAVPYHESTEVQRKSDLLLLLMWDDPKEHSVLTGKLFEYVGARRPIIQTGYEGGEAAALIKDRSLGVVTNDVDNLKEHLERWVLMKQSLGSIPAPDSKVGRELTREEQARMLFSFLQKVQRRKIDGCSTS